jgi:integrase/recombinase XerD
MKLSTVIDNYVEFKRALGMRLRSEAAQLQAFGRAMGDVDIEQVKAKAVLAFIDGNRPVTATWKQCFSVLSSFYRYAISRGFTTTAPLPTTRPKIPPPQAAYIYTTNDLKRLLAATALLQTRNSSPWRARAFRALLLLLYGTGLRIGEALSLTLRDVDLSAAVITVRNTKFFKSRQVPIGPKLTRELANYANIRRHRQPLPAGEDSAFFANSLGARWGYKYTHKHFRRVCLRACVVRKGDQARQPRLHDLRHSAAQHRIEAWYREGKDVPRLLPQLATYMGHRDIACLQHYLHMTPELLREASRRFERYAQP